MNVYNDTNFNQRISDLVSEILLLVANFSKSLSHCNFQDYLYPKLQNVLIIYFFSCRAENILDNIQYKDSVLKNWKSEGKHRRESTDEGDFEEKPKVPSGS